MRTKIAVLAVVLGLIAVQSPSMADVSRVHIHVTPDGFEIPYISDTLCAPAPVETPVAPATAAVQTAARVSVNPADALPINANNVQNLEPGMNFVDMQCIKIAPSALLPKAF